MEKQLNDSFSFSTCWNVDRHTNGRAMIGEIQSLGFRQVELNYEVPETMLESIYPMVDRGEIQISSVHCVFPYVANNDKDYGCNSLFLGYTDPDKRKRSIELLLETVEYAARFGARAVVVHPGEVEVPYNYDRVLTDLYDAGQYGSAEYRKEWQEMMDIRQRDSRFFVDIIVQSLEEVANRMAQKGYDVAIGLETRSRAYQIPTIQEVKYIMNQLKGAPIYLWYDIGHGMLMDKMELYDHIKEAPEVKDRIIGLHIHEAIGLSDHWCPYIHSKDDHYYDHFLEIIRDAPIKVFELKSRCTPEEINSSFERIKHKILNLKG